MNPEELFLTAAQALKEQREQPYGPPITPEMNGPAGDACVKLCGGDQDQARTLWKLIVSDLGGYMPRAAVFTLIRAANTVNLVPDIEAPDLT